METSITPSTPDDQLIGLWLHGRQSKHTKRAYRFDTDKLLAFVRKPLIQVTLADLQVFADTLKGEPETRRRTLAAVKSLFRFAARLGYLPFDVAAPLILPKPKDDLAQRILTRKQVKAMVGAAKDHPRDFAILTLIYVTGIRVSESASLRWCDCVPRKKGGQITVTGKGEKTRTIRIKSRPWERLMSIRPMIEHPEDAVFNLSDSQIRRIVNTYAEKAGFEASPHFLRHAFASHSLDAGAPVHLVQATMGHKSLDTTTRYVHARPSDSASFYVGTPG